MPLSFLGGGTKLHRPGFRDCRAIKIVLQPSLRRAPLLGPFNGPACQAGNTDAGLFPRWSRF
jgi:hypothetical protein